MTAQGIFAIFFALVLRWLRVVAVEIELVQSAHMTLRLLDNVAHLHRGVRLHALSDRVGVPVELLDAASAEVVLPAVAALLDLFGGVGCAAEQDINDDLRLVIDNIHALTHGTFDVDIVDGSTVHVNTFTRPLMGRKHERNGGRGDGSVGQLGEQDVLLIKLRVLPHIHVHGSESHPPFKAVKSRYDAPKES